MAEKKYSTEEVQKVANQIRKQILGVALQTGGCYLAQACILRNNNMRLKYITKFFLVAASGFVTFAACSD